MSGWIQTYTGKRVDVLDISLADFDIRDIAHSLACINRFTGHTREPYSVAQHSVLVADYVRDAGADSETVLAALMHDAPEAYINDLARPIKHAAGMSGYREIERRIEFRLAERFGLVYPLPDIVKRADEVLLVTEVRDLLPGPLHPDWPAELRPDVHEVLPGPIVAWNWRAAEAEFLARWFVLMGQR